MTESPESHGVLRAHHPGLFLPGNRDYSTPILLPSRKFPILPLFYLEIDFEDLGSIFIRPRHRIRTLHNGLGVVLPVVCYAFFPEGA